MKRVYFIRHAKAEGFIEGVSDFERAVKKRGLKDIETIGSYLALQKIKPDVILSSCAMRAEQTALNLAKKLDFDGKKYFLEELYYAPHEELVSILMAQEESCESIFVIGHNPQLNELVNALSSQYINKIPTMGVVALSFDMDSWSDINSVQGEVEFFIYPKQFQYYMPKQIRTTLNI